jgi:hypothetical protein
VIAEAFTRPTLVLREQGADPPAAPDSASNLTVTFDGSIWTITDPGGVRAASPFICTQVSFTVATCQVDDPITFIDVDLGAQDDQLVLPDAVPSVEYADVLLGAGNDYVKAGAEITTVEDGEGDDEVDLGGGDDMFTAGPGNNTIRGGAGADYIDGGPGNDVLDGGPGDDAMTGGGGDDRLAGGADADQLEYFDVRSAGVDLVTGEDGDDEIETWGGDSAEGGAGNDFLRSNGAVSASGSNDLDCDSGDADFAMPETADFVNVDCDLASQLYACDSNRCNVELKVTSRPSNAKAGTNGKRLVLAHKKFRLTRKHDPEDPLGAKLIERSVRKLLRKRHQAPVISSFTYTDERDKRRNIKAPYILTDQ